MHRPSDAERQAITDAVERAEAGTSGEIVTIIADRSDSYHDVGLHYAIAVVFLAAAAYAAFPGFYVRIITALSGGWHVPDMQELLIILWCALVIKFLASRYIMAWMPLRLALTPRSTKRRRVRRRAIDLFKVGAEARTVGRTGILIYLSLGERMAEIVADEAIHSQVPDERWGDAMRALIADVKQDRIADGMIAAVGQVGAILAEHLPRAADDRNELPDRVIEL